MSYLEQEILTRLHYDSWSSVLGWFVIFGLFITFLPFHRKSRMKPTSMYLAFILASALEMFGIPLSMYFVAWAFGISLPVGLLWGHTLAGYIGNWGMYTGFALNLIGGALIVQGWRAVYTRYWSKEEEEERNLVTDGIYTYSRHPQYAGFIIMTLGLLVHWATLPLLIMWPLLVFQYYRLARREEIDMEAEFGEEYQAYRERTPMFIPFSPSALANLTRESRNFIVRSALGGLALMAVYIIVLTIGNSFEHALAELMKWWPWIAVQVGGFGAQIGMFFHMRDLAEAGRWTGYKSSLAVGGGVSATSMVACCLHHITDVLPIIGLSAATLLLTRYQSVFMSLGVLSNLVGVLFMLEHVQRFSDSNPLGDRLSSFLSQYDLKRIRNISLLSSGIIFIILLASTLGVFPSSKVSAEGVVVINDKNGVTFTIKPVDYGDDVVAFLTLIDTHQGTLSFDMMDVATLEVSGTVYKPILWDGSPPGGHHRSGVLVFPTPSKIGYIKLTVRDVYDVPERVFEWGASTAGLSSDIYTMGGVSVVAASTFILALRSRKDQDKYYESLFEEERKKF